MIRRLIIKFKHKTAWHLRKWANKLEPEITRPNIMAPLLYRGKEYELTEIRHSVKHESFNGTDYELWRIEEARRQVGRIVSDKYVEVQAFPDGDETKSIVQLLILTPKNAN